MLRRRDLPEENRNDEVRPCNDKAWFSAELTEEAQARLPPDSAFAPKVPEPVCWRSCSGCFAHVEELTIEGQEKRSWGAVPLAQFYEPMTWCQCYPERKNAVGC